MEWFGDWTGCVSLCHESQSFHSRQRLIDQLRELPARINGAPPILAAKVDDVAAYVVIHPGCLCSVGGIFLPKPMRAEDAVRAGQLLNQIIEHASLETEIVQAITYAGDNNTILEACYAVAGLKKVADLNQMECSLSMLGTDAILSPNDKGIGNKTGNNSSIAYIAWEPAYSEFFAQLVDETYVHTLDVPELNGIRDSNNTLAGYAACLPPGPRPWWVLRNSNGDNIGCLLLCPYSDFAELVYVGLVPESRGKGYASAIMQFAHNWALQRGLHRMVLAVDHRNVPAIKLYQSLGYDTFGSVTAWIRSTRTAT